MLVEDVVVLMTITTPITEVEVDLEAIKTEDKIHEAVVRILTEAEDHITTIITDTIIIQIYHN